MSIFVTGGLRVKYKNELIEEILEKDPGHPCYLAKRFTVWMHK